MATAAVRVALAVVLALGLTGCADDDCGGASYDVDLTQAGSATPIEALDLWLDTHDGIATDPPEDDWIQQGAAEGAGDAATVVLVNDDGDVWWVSVRRTSSDGWVVEQATDDATGCGDDLTG
jgi:hypothetical protein